MIRRFALLALLLWPPTVYAECLTYLTSSSSGGYRRYLRHTVCDTQAERPAGTTTALQVSLNGPASPTAVRFTVWTATSATASHNASQNAYDANTNPASALTTALPVRLVGTVENVNAGTLALRMRTEVSGSSVTIQRGSWCALF